MSHFRLFLLSLFTFLLHLSTYAQISQGGSPFSFRHAELGTVIPEVLLPGIDLSALQVEDSIRDVQKLPYRFGKEINMNLDLNNSGLWQRLPNGDRLWRVQIHAPGAKTINLIYSDFFLPHGASLFLYSPDRQHILGAFTERNNKPYRKFSTSLLRGETTILEYYEPAKVAGQGIIEIETIVHGYRGFAEQSARAFGDSGPCNNNVNCPEGIPWQQEIRSVALILVGGFRACTGAMINNVRDDCTPYFLTANHCLVGNVNTWMFLFNYESPDCSNTDGPTNMTVSGATLRSNGQNSDFALLELSASPPFSYQVFHSGFSADTIPADSTIAIHHPAGDIKKISFNHDPVFSAQWFPTSPDTHWEVSEWEDGTTEPGSSGSPLFDQHHRIVGQLHGGAASCTVIDYDQYGKVSYSWTAAAAPSAQLKHWLDPDDTGVLVMDGRECGSAPTFFDAGIVQVLHPAESLSCEDTVAAEILLRNFGLPLNFIGLQYRWDNDPWQSLFLTDSLGFLESTTLSIPSSTFSTGSHTLEVAISNVNGSADAVSLNDSLQFEIDIIEGRDFEVQLQTDGFPEETSFEILDVTGQVLYVASAFDSVNHSYLLPFCLEPGCYDLKLMDSFGDGISVQTALNIFDRNGTLLSSVSGAFQTEITVSFCIPYWEPIAVIEASDTIICAGQSVQFSSGSLYTDSVVWAFAGGTPAISTDSFPSVSYLLPGLYDVFLTASGPGGLDNAVGPQLVEVVAPPSLSISPANATSYFLSDGAVNVEVQGGLPPYTYTWSNGVTTMDSILTDLAPGAYSVAVQDAIGCLTTEAFVIGPAVGIEEELLKASIQLYPNPHEGPFTLARTDASGRWTVRMFNSVGQEVGEAKVFAIGEEQMYLNLRDQPLGIYLVQIQSEKAVVQLRVVRQ